MVVFEKPHALTDKPFHYCPGCTHGIIHRLVAECIDEFGVEGKAVGVAPVGCSVFAYNYFNCDMIEAPHGRAPAVATGVKRANPGKLFGALEQLWFNKVQLCWHGLHNLIDDAKVKRRYGKK